MAKRAEPQTKSQPLEVLGIGVAKNLTRLNVGKALILIGFTVWVSWVGAHEAKVFPQNSDKRMGSAQEMQIRTSLGRVKWKVKTNARVC